MYQHASLRFFESQRSLVIGHHFWRSLPICGLAMVL
jgi:hypothetical protein